MGCLDPRTLADLRTGRLRARAAERASAHLAACASCRAKSSQVKRITDTLQVIATAPPPVRPTPSPARLEAMLRWTRLHDGAEVSLPARTRLGAMAAAFATLATIAGGALVGRSWHRHAPALDAPPVATRVEPARPAPAPPAPTSVGHRALVTLLAEGAGPAPSFRPEQPRAEEAEPMMSAPRRQGSASYERVLLLDPGSAWPAGQVPYAEASGETLATPKVGEGLVSRDP